MNSVTYTVPSINCNHCIHTIKTELSDLAGVVAVDADLASKKVKINYTAPATESVIEETLTEINYPVQK